MAKDRALWLISRWARSPRTLTEPRSSLGSKSQIAWRSRRSSVARSMVEAVRPARSGMPKLMTEPAAEGSSANPGIVFPGCVVLKSQVRSLRTHSRSWLGESTRRSRGSTFAVGSSSVRRSSSDGCTRSRGVSSAIGTAVAVRAALRAPVARVEPDHAHVHERVLAAIGGERALPSPCPALRPGGELRPLGSPGETDPRILARLRTRVAGGDEARDLGACLQGEVGGHPDQVAQGRGRLEADHAQALEGHPRIPALDDDLEHGPQPRVSVGDPVEGRSLDISGGGGRRLEGPGPKPARPRVFARGGEPQGLQEPGHPLLRLPDERWALPPREHGCPDGLGS